MKITLSHLCWMLFGISMIGLFLLIALGCNNFLTATAIVPFIVCVTIACVKEGELNKVIFTTNKYTF